MISAIQYKLSGRKLILYIKEGWNNGKTIESSDRVANPSPHALSSMPYSLVDC